MSHVPHSEHPMEDCSSVQPTFQTPASSRTLSSRTTKRPRRFSDSVDSPPSHQQPRPPPTSTRRKSPTPSSKKLVVEQILDQRSRAGEEDEVLIHWKGFPMDQATWEPISNTDCPNLLLSFFSSRKEAVPPSTPPILRHAIPPSTNSQAQSPRRNQHRPSPLRQRKDYLIPLPNPQRSQLPKRSHQKTNKSHSTPTPTFAHSSIPPHNPVLTQQLPPIMQSATPKKRPYTKRQTQSPRSLPLAPQRPTPRTSVTPSRTISYLLPLPTPSLIPSADTHPSCLASQEPPTPTPTLNAAHGPRPPDHPPPLLPPFPAPFPPPVFTVSTEPTIPSSYLPPLPATPETFIHSVISPTGTQRNELTVGMNQLSIRSAPSLSLSPFFPPTSALSFDRPMSSLTVQQLTRKATHEHITTQPQKNAPTSTKNASTCEIAHTVSLKVHQIISVHLLFRLILVQQQQQQQQ